MEINQRINYPVKRILVAMEGSDEVDMTGDIAQFVCHAPLSTQLHLL